MKLTLSILTIVLSFSLANPDFREGVVLPPDLTETSESVEKVEAVKVTPKALKTPQEAPKPVKPTYPVGCENYLAEVSKYPWDVPTMMRIMGAESGCNPKNHNWGDNHISCLGSYGLFQIGCVHGYSVAYLENPYNNIAVAYKIWQAQGYTAWTTY